jgi:hypothetical protein
MRSAETGNTFIGHMAAANYYNPSGNADGRNTAIGVGTIVDNDLENSTAIGQSSRVCTDNTIVIGSYSILGGGVTQGNEYVIVGDCKPTFSSPGDIEIIGPTNGLWANGLFTPSDIRLKKDIRPIINAVQTIDKINGYTYYYRNSEESEFILPKNKQVGVLAQELEEFYPYALKKAKNGFYGVDYIKIIPLLLAGIKEQNEIIEELTRQIEQIKEKKDSINQTPNGRVFQNNPNPFDNYTTIEYDIENDFTFASIVVHSINGEKITTLNIDNNKGLLTIEKGKLNTGIYFYSLVVDNRVLDSKTMIISK